MSGGTSEASGILAGSGLGSGLASKLSNLSELWNEGQRLMASDDPQERVMGQAMFLKAQILEKTASMVMQTAASLISEILRNSQVK